MANSIYNTIVSPIYTEKTTNLGELNNQFTFKVAKDADKIAIKKAVEQIFGAKVEKIQIINVSGKRKVFKGRKGKRPDYKKAVVVLKQGEKIEL